MPISAARSECEGCAFVDPTWAIARCPWQLNASTFCRKATVLGHVASTWVLYFSDQSATQSGCLT